MIKPAIISRIYLRNNVDMIEEFKLYLSIFVLTKIIVIQIIIGKVNQLSIFVLKKRIVIEIIIGKVNQLYFEFLLYKMQINVTNKLYEEKAV